MKTKSALLIVGIFTALISQSLEIAHAESSTNTASLNYPRAAEPGVPFAFTPLPLGKVEPKGWLRDWAEAARNGITGHLDERSPVFHDGWKGTPIKWTGANPDGTGWPLEQSAYWMDGAIRLGYILHDQWLIKKIRARLDPIVNSVNKADFGTSFVYWKKNWKPTGFNSWAHSQMGRALVALYSGSGDKRVLKALTKVYSDYPSSSLGWPALTGSVAGLCNLDAMMETYAFSGDRRILDRALAAINRPDVRHRIQEWAVGKVTAGHMVITYEDARLPAIMYPWTGDKKLLRASEGVFRWLDKNNMLPYGLASGEEFAAGVGAARKTETCNVQAMLNSADWMYRIEGDGTWGDRMEKVFFNAGPSPISRDFQTAAYYQTPNRIKLGYLPQESPSPGTGGIAFGPLACPRVLCCIGSCNRILPYFIANMWMATDDNGLAATLYGPCRVNALAGPHVPVKIDCATAYPFNESIRMAITPQTPVEFPLYLRIPGWCKEPVIEINGQRIEAEAAPGKRDFVRINRTWSKGDTVTLHLPMRVSLVRGFEGPYPRQLHRSYFQQIPNSMFRPRALPYASVDYGPLLFCLPIPDKDPNTPVAGAKWNYALDMNPADAAKLKVERSPMPAHWDWPLASPVTLNVPVRAFDWMPTLAQDLPDAPVNGGKPRTVTLVPYGCTKFHISMFPVTPRTWEGKSLPVIAKEEPELLGNADYYGDAAATGGEAIGYINTPGSAVIWHELSAGNQIKFCYSAEKPAQLTLRINNGAPRKITFPATGKWHGSGAYSEVAVPVTVPPRATVRLMFKPGDVPANIASVAVTK